MNMFKKSLVLVLVVAVVGIVGSRASAAVLTTTFSGDGDTGGDVYDAMVAKAYPITGFHQASGEEGRNYGGLSWIGANESAGWNDGYSAPEGENTRLLIRFDVSALAGQFASIVSIELRLYQLDASSANISVHRITDANSNWEEGLDTGTLNTSYGWWNRTTWDRKLGGLSDSLWAGGLGLTVPGADYDAVPLATGAGTGSAGSWTSLSLTGDLTGLMNEWALSPVIDRMAGVFASPQAFTNVANEGLLIMADDASRWSSSEGDFSPELVVRYTPIPEPATMSIIGCGAIGLLRRRRSRTRRGGRA